MSYAQPRRTVLIDRRFQLRYVLWLTACGIAMAGLFGLWAWQAHQQAVELFARDPERLAVLRLADRHLLWALLGIGVLSAAALGLLGFLMTHRVAGPVWVMGHALAELARGRYPRPLSLRRGDELRPLFQLFHEAVEALAERDRRTLAALDATAERLRAAAAREPDVAAALAAIEAEARPRREALAAESAPEPAGGAASARSSPRRRPRSRRIPRPRAVRAFRAPSGPMRTAGR